MCKPGATNRYQPKPGKAKHANAKPYRREKNKSYLMPEDDQY